MISEENLLSTDYDDEVLYLEDEVYPKKQRPNPHIQKRIPKIHKNPKRGKLDKNRSTRYGRKITR